MPPRLSLPRLGAALCLRPAPKPVVPAAQVANASTKAKRHQYRDPYALAQSKQRKMANVKRQEELQKLRNEAMGDPVRGVTTPFVESFQNPESVNDGKTGAFLNYYLNSAEIEQTMQHSFILTQPKLSKDSALADPEKEEEAIERHREGHERATAAIKRIVALENGNQMDKMRVNVQRCVETFGRHQTDAALGPRLTDVTKEHGTESKTPRAGPDTGSSEVQIAILTAKIHNLANELDKTGRTDKVNKRNLRLLVHRRQKLLTYLRRKERGGPRWQHLVETLGLTEGTWKGEISL